MENIDKSLIDQEAKLLETYKFLNSLKTYFTDDQLVSAGEALKKGKVGAAEDLFKQILDKGVRGIEPAAEAAFQLGVLAEFLESIILRLTIITLKLSSFNLKIPYIYSKQEELLISWGIMQRPNFYIIRH